MTQLLFVIDSWPSQAGGIQTVNRELCLAVGRLATGLRSAPISAVCLCTRSLTEEDETGARTAGVRLLLAKEVQFETRFGDEERIVRSASHPELGTLRPQVILGHSRFTGFAARHLRDQHFPDAKVVTFYHMDADETEGLKDPSASQSQLRAEIEREVALNADYVIAIGPRLTRKIGELLSGASPAPPIAQLLCGMSASCVTRLNPPDAPTFLYVGRADHPEVKGLDLFIRAAGRLTREWATRWQEVSPREPLFIIRGVTVGSEGDRLFESFTSMAESEASRKVSLVRRSYTSHPDELKSDILRASAVVMPSRSEGFGLVALEAISYGIPAIVARESGVGELFASRLPPLTTAQYIIDTRLSDSEAVDGLVRAMLPFVSTPQRAHLLGASLKRDLLASCSWDAAARKLLEVLDIRLTRSEPVEDVATQELKQLLDGEITHVNAESARTSGRPLDEFFVERSFERWIGPGDASISPATVPARQADQSPVGWATVLEGGRKTMLLGDPGSGKTVLLLQEVSKRCETAREALLNNGKSASAALHFGVYLHASELVNALDKGLRTTGEAITEVVCRRHLIRDECRRWIQNALAEGRVLVAIDGLDELSDLAARQLVNQRVVGMTDDDSPGPVIVSSRVMGYDGTYSGSEWHVLRLSTPQMRKAISKWLSPNSDAIATFAASVALLEPLQEVLKNPLMLMLACRVVEAALRNGAQIPEFRRRCELYSAAVGGLYERWTERAAVLGHAPGLTERQEFPAFVEHFAWELWRRDPHQTAFASASVIEAIQAVQASHPVLGRRTDLLDDLCQAGVILVTTRGALSTFVFLHRTILEFLAARHVARAITTAPEMLTEAQPYFGRPEAHVFLWMLVGQLAAPERLMRSVVDWVSAQLESPREHQPATQAPVAAELLADCVLEAPPGTLTPDTLTRTWELIIRGLDRRQRSQRKVGEWTKLANRSVVDRALVAVAKHEGGHSGATDASLIVADACRASGELPPDRLVAITSRTLGSTCVMVQWAGLWAAMSLRGRADTLPGLLGTHLNEILKSQQSPHLRSAVARAIGDLDGRTAIPILTATLATENQYVAAGAAMGLGRTRAADVLPTLIRIAEVSTLSATSDRREPLLVAVLGALDALVGERVVLGAAGPPVRAALQAVLLSALRSPLPLVQGTAASALSKLKAREAWPVIRDILYTARGNGDDVHVMRGTMCFACDQLVPALDSKDLREAETLFRRILGSPTERPPAKRAAASGISKLIQRGHSSVGLVNDLLRAAQDADSLVAGSALFALIQLPESAVLEDLLLLLKSFGPPRRQLFCERARSGVMSSTCFRALVWMLGIETNPTIVASAYYALCRREGDRQAIRPIRQLANADDLDEIRTKAMAFTYHAAPDVVAGALNALCDLGQIFHSNKDNRLAPHMPEMLARTRELLGRPEPVIISSACYALSSLGTIDDIPIVQSLLRSPSAAVASSAGFTRHQLRQRLGR